jgi:hypothetical protein
VSGIHHSACSVLTFVLRVVQKLEDLGWSADLASMDEQTETEFSKLSEINRPRDLTDRCQFTTPVTIYDSPIILLAWTLIKKNVINFMESVRAKLNANTSLNELASRISIIREIRLEFVRGRPIDEPQPCLADLCCMEGFRTSLCIPSGQLLTAETVEALRISVPRLLESWRQYTSNKLVDTLPPSQNLMLNPQYRLALATSFFKCYKCKDPISYPRILVHRCITSVSDNIPQLVDPAVDFLGSLASILRQQPWSLENDAITFYQQAAHAAHIVVEATGLDPYTTTYRVMDKRDSWFLCSLCSTGEGELEGLLVMSWDSAVRRCRSWRYPPTHRLLSGCS